MWWHVVHWVFLLYLLLYFKLWITNFMFNIWENMFYTKVLQLYVDKTLGPHRLLITTVENYYWNVYWSFHTLHPDYFLNRNDSTKKKQGLGKTLSITNKRAKPGRLLGVSEEVRFSNVRPHLPDKLSSSRRCRLCSTKAHPRRSRFQCSTCLVGLCISPCFKNFHIMYS